MSVSLRALLLLLLAGLAAAPAAAGDASEPLPVIGPAPGFALSSQDGKPVSLAALRGKVVVVAFIFTGCSSICPLLTQKMVQVQDALGADFGTKVAFVSITLDPEHDTPQALQDYARAWGAKRAGWSFLTGPPETVAEVTRQYGVFAAQKQDGGGIDHTQLTSIVDAEGALRVQYLGARFDPDEFRHDLLSLLYQP